MLEMIKNLFLLFARFDFWSFLSLLMLILGSVAGYLKFYRPRKSIRNFIVNFHYERAPGWNFPLRITIAFANHTGRNVHIASASFKCKDLRPDPKAMGDTYTGKMPMKFPKEVTMSDGTKQILLQEFEYYLKIDESTGSYAPIDPDHTDEEVEQAFMRGKVGTFDCYVTLLSRDHKPLVHRLRIKPQKQFPAKQGS